MSSARRPVAGGVRVLLVAVALWLASCAAVTKSNVADNLLVGADKDGGAQAIAVNPANEPASEDDAEVPIGTDDPVRGNRLALVTIVVFSDFQCPFCGRLEATLDRVAETYGEDLRFVFKNEPLSFHQHARLAAETAQGVLVLKGQDAFWRFHDMAFRRQQLIGPDTIRAWAVASGADSREIAEGIARKKWSAKVDKDEALAKKLGVNGTPGSFVNGVEVSGAQPFEKWKEVIDRELENAKALAQAGVARDRIYARMTAANWKDAKTRDDKDEQEEEAKEAAELWRVPIGTSPTRGTNGALVTVVEFGDFQCPYCKRVQPVLERLRTEYGDRIRFVWKDDPLSFHPHALPAAEAARSARAQKGDAAFWIMHDKLMEATSLDDADLERVGASAGVDGAKIGAAIRNKQFAKLIEEDLGLAEDIKASGTPHFFINGHRLTGAQPYEAFKSLVDTEMKKAEALVRNGTAKTAVYDTIMKDGKGPPEPARKSVAASITPAPFRGAANAKVVIQEFSDFQCPFCSRAEPTIDELLKQYPTQVKVVWRNLPLSMHVDAELAAEAAHEAFAQKGNEGFSKMRELLFKHQADVDGLKRSALEGYAGTVGLDLKRFGKALDDGTHKARIASDKQAADDAGISGTPAFVVGTYYVSGAQPLAKFKRVVDRVLSEPVAAPPPPAGPAVTLPGGLIVKDVVVGSGPAVKSGDTINVHYVGSLTDGTEFDSSRKHGDKPFSFAIGAGHVIKGWDQGLIGMKVGGRRKLTIPPDLAYGDRGAAGVIPPKSTLLFDVELVSIK